MLLAVSTPANSAALGTLTDVVLTLLAAVVLGAIMQRLRQNVLLGYLLAGVLIGPGALGIVRDPQALSTLGEVGVALLLFTIGLELPWQRVQTVGARALSAGFLQVAATIAIATPLLHAHGLSWQGAGVGAMAISLSSTAVVIRLLADRAETDAVHGLTALGMLLAQDLTVVGFLLVVPQLGVATGGDPVQLVSELGISLAKLGGLVAATWLIELVLMRRVFRNAALGVERELLSLASLVVSLGAVGACYALDLSPALGGFVAGVIMADAPYADQVRAELSTVRVALVALFFAWVGMLAQPGWMFDHGGQIVGAVLGIVVGKFVITYVALRALRVAGFAALLTAAALAQLGEFSFAIVALGRTVGAIDGDTFQLFVSASLITLLLTPALMAATARVIGRRGVRGVQGGAEAHGDGALASGDAHPTDGHVVVIGHGPAGKEVVRAMRERDRPVTIIELNPRVRIEPPPGTRVVYGDAVQPEILERAGVHTAALLVVTIPEPASLRRMVRQVRAHEPDLPVVARGRYNLYLDQVREAGATHVVDEESVTGRELGRVALELLDGVEAAGIDARASAGAGDVGVPGPATG